MKRFLFLVLACVLAIVFPTNALCSTYDFSTLIDLPSAAAVRQKYNSLLNSIGETRLDELSWLSEDNMVLYWETPDSTCFSAVGYNDFEGVLHVVFRESGKEYAYYSFDMQAFLDFINAKSLGTYYNKYIKWNYECSGALN